MRIARKLPLPALMAIAAMAISASTASAQTVEITNEHTGLHCASNGSNCALHGSGEMTLRGHVFGIEATASDCIVELDGSVNEDGSGSVTGAVFTDHVGLNDCTRIPCPPRAGDTTPIRPWPGQAEEDTSGVVTAHVEYCIEDAPSGGNQNRCLIETAVSGIAGTAHDYEAAFNDQGGVSHSGGLPCELTGSIHMETGDAGDQDEIEIAHL